MVGRTVLFRNVGRLLLVLLIAAVSCDGDILIGNGDPPGPVEDDSGTNDAWYEIFFTNPSCPPEAERLGGLDGTIADDLRQAVVQVDVAAFDLDAQPIIDALVELAGRGVRVRVVTDDDNGELPGVERLREAGVKVVEDGRSALMHDKFIVVDGRFLWMGSMNYTSNGAYCNNNNLVRIDSPRLSANYLAEMAEMYDEGSFGPTSPRNTPNERLSVDGVQVENYFGPEAEIAPIITRIVDGAQKEILFLAFSFTLEEIGEAMLARARDGVEVKGVFETSGSETMFSYYPIMRNAGLPNVIVLQDGNSRLMHHKVIIIDQETVIFGSFNYSQSANDNNDENVLIVHDQVFTRYFVEEFIAVWEEANG